MAAVIVSLLGLKSLNKEVLACVVGAFHHSSHHFGQHTEQVQRQQENKQQAAFHEPYRRSKVTPRLKVDMIGRPEVRPPHACVHMHMCHSTRKTRINKLGLQQQGDL